MMRARADRQDHTQLTTHLHSCCLLGGEFRDEPQSPSSSQPAIRADRDSLPLISGSESLSAAARCSPQQHAALPDTFQWREDIGRFSIESTRLQTCVLLESGLGSLVLGVQTPEDGRTGGREDGRTGGREDGRTCRKLLALEPYMALPARDSQLISQLMMRAAGSASRQRVSTAAASLVQPRHVILSVRVA
ncbi:hypothetical protein EYF80_028466 [Liparis tanakae]|uniref:Uncharacterized protein n=1 Tax=Liparis tanakae TaxID=230148 RepID=A0A4Z2H6A2_9TELE|nr:hypothetical protein EYF80_028466 [Liparis tanakae]